MELPYRYLVDPLLNYLNSRKEQSLMEAKRNQQEADEHRLRAEELARLARALGRLIECIEGLPASDRFRFASLEPFIRGDMLSPESDSEISNFLEGLGRDEPFGDCETLLSKFYKAAELDQIKAI